MGNFSDHQSNINQDLNSDSFLSTIEKVSQIYYQYWGTNNIYQLKIKPYDYFVQFIDRSMGDQQLIQQKLKFYTSLPKNKHIVEVKHAQIVKKEYPFQNLVSKDFCKPFDFIRIFCPYYNFTLQNAINLKIKQKTLFTQPNILYILKSLISVGKFYQQSLDTNFYSGIFKAKSIFITPEGHIKIYPFNENIFSSFLKKKNLNQLIKKQESNEKKYHNKEMDQTIKANSLTRDQSILSKNGLTKSKSIYRKSKITTTLKNQSIAQNSFTQQILQLKGIQNTSFLFKQNQKNLSISRQQSTQTLNFLKIKSTKQAHRKDLFQLGLLLMQIILLNDDKYYYINTKQQKNYQYTNQKIPNFDLINFSLEQLLLKKKMSSFLIKLIERFLGKNINQQLNFEDIYNQIQQYLQINENISFCLRFQVDEPETKSQIFYRLPKNSQSPNKKNQNKKQENIYLLKTNSKQNLMNSTVSSNFQPKQLKDIHFSTKLQSLMSNNNLSKSFIIEDDNNSQMILNRLKGSKKLVPHRIRSISTKLDQPSKKNQ